MSFSVLLILSLGGTGAGQAQDLRALVLASGPTIVQNAPGATGVQFTLENRTSKDVTAWGVDLRCIRPDGTIVTRSYMEETFATYENLLSAERRARKVLLSQNAITPTVALGSTTFSDVSVSVSFVVFADRTSLGDARAIGEVFEERDRAFKAWTVILAALRSAQAAGANRESLTVALQYLNAPNQEDYEQSDKNGMRRSLRVVIDKSPDNVAAGQFLQESIDRAQGIITALNKHKRSEATGIR